MTYIQTINTAKVINLVAPIIVKYDKESLLDYFDFNIYGNEAVISLIDFESSVASDIKNDIINVLEQNNICISESFVDTFNQMVIKVKV